MSRRGRTAAGCSCERIDMAEETEIRRCHAGARGGAAQTRKVRKDGWTQARREIFLLHLAMTSNVAASAREAGIAAKNAYTLRRRDSGFRAAWREALAEGFEHHELEMLERFRFGTARTIVRGGEIVVERVFSDAVGMRLLQAHRDSVASYRAEAADRPVEEVFAEMKARLAQVRARLEEREAGDEG